MKMEYSRSDNPAGASSGLRRSVGEATERIQEIIDAAERVAEDIRRDAEAEARRYLDERRREADRLAEERNTVLDELTKALADNAEQFKQHAERLLADLDQVIADVRAGVYRQSASTRADEPRAETFTSEPRDPVAPPPLEPLGGRGLDLGSTTSRLGADDPFELPPLEREPVEPITSLREPVPEPEPELRERERPAAAVSAYPGHSDSWRDEAPADSDATSQALLRATQLAVTGKGRAEIADVLRTDFPSVDAEPLLDEILD